MMQKRSYKPAVLGLILACCFFGSAGQSAQIDSLEKILQRNALADSTRIETLLQLGWELSFSNGDSARFYLQECIALAEKNSDPLNTGNGYAYTGSSYFKKDLFDSALYYYQKADGYYAKDPSPDGKESLVVNRMSMGTVALQQGRHETAIGYYLKAIDYMEKNPSPDNWKNRITAYANIGLVYNDLKQFDKALQYHRRALDICNRHPEELEKTVQVKMFVALDLLNLKEFDKVLPALQSAEPLLRKLNSDYFFSIFYVIRGRYFNDRKNWRPAIASLKEGLACAVRNKQKFQKANALYQLGISYLGLGNYAESLKYFEPALAINRELHDKVREMASLNNLAKSNLLDHNYKEAAGYYGQYISLSDSLHDSQAQKRINEIENKYQAEKKQAAINALKKDNEWQKSELHQKTLFIAGLVTGCFLLLLIAGLMYKNYKNKHRLLVQNETLHKQRISQMEKERKLVAAESVMKGQEAERSRLARDLHDGVGGLLSGVKLSMSDMKGNMFLSEENAQAFASVITQLDISIAELRRVSHNMMPEALLKYGLKEAVENYCENLNLSADKMGRKGNFRVQLQAYGMEERMEQSTEIVVYRIIQELLNNVIRHAGARNVLVQLARVNDRFNLTVEDDGNGFDTSELHNRSGAGLANIRARAEYLSGNVDIVSRKGEGTSVHIEGNCFV